VESELGLSQISCEAFVPTVEPFGVYEHRETFVEGEARELGVLVLLLPGIGKGTEPHGAKLFKCRFIQHWEVLPV